MKQSIGFGKETRAIYLNLNLPVDLHDLSIFTYTNRSTPVGWRIENLSFIEGTEEFIISDGGLSSKPVNFDKTWRQEKNRITVTWLGRDFFADMPPGFKLAAVSDRRMEVVNDMLFGNIETSLFGRTRLLLSKNLPPAGDFGRNDEFRTKRIILCFSAGEDSTAALRILPPEITQPYFSERPYAEYFRFDGRRVQLNPTVNEERALERVASVIRVPTNFETIGISVGLRHGYQDNFGYAALAVLLAEYLDANVVAFGSVLEQVFMKSGYDFTDIVHYRGARYNRYRDMFASAGLVYALPTGVMSEVITNRICTLSRDRYLAVPCPNTDVSGNACGRCFKCFRKQRLEGKKELADPLPAVGTVLSKRPLKSATSLVYSVQKSGYAGHEIDEYLTVDLSMLERYFGKYLSKLVPPDVASRIEEEMRQLGFSSMNEDDEYRIRTIAKIFSPEDFNPRRAFPVSPSVTG